MPISPLQMAQFKAAETAAAGMDVGHAAIVQLMERFELSEIQANAILNMALRRLAALEAQQIQDEYDELLETIADLQDILDRPERVRAIIREELTDLGECPFDQVACSL